MEYIILIVLGLILARFIMVVMALGYRFLFLSLPLIAILMSIIGLLIGLLNAIKNTVIAAKKVYGKK